MYFVKRTIDVKNRKSLKQTNNKLDQKLVIKIRFNFVWKHTCDYQIIFLKRKVFIKLKSPTDAKWNMQING